MRKRATVIVFRNNKVLLVRDRGKHHFSFPGGAIRKGEPNVSAAARELYEELGLHPVRVTRLSGCDYNGSTNEHKVCLIEASGEPRLRRHELDKFMWWDMKEPVPTYAHVEVILKKLQFGHT